MPRVLELPVEHLATTLAPLRGPRTDPASSLAPLPLRVAARNDGTYEVLDGFKRLASWTHDGHTHVPVVVEDALGVVRKARLLEANAPRRTLSPMDEARVVRSLADEDHLTPTQIAKLLGRGRGWVDRRLMLGRRLTPAVAEQVVRLAHTLQEETAHADPRGTRRTAPTPARAHSDSRDRPPARPGRQDDPPGAGPTAPTAAAPLEARPLSSAGQGAARGGPARAADPEGTARAGLPGRAHDPEGVPAHPGAAPPDAPGVPPLRNGPGGRGAVGLEPLPRDDRQPRDDRARLRDGPGPLAQILRGLLP